MFWFVNSVYFQILSSPPSIFGSQSLCKLQYSTTLVTALTGTLEGNSPAELVFQTKQLLSKHGSNAPRNKKKNQNKPQTKHFFLFLNSNHHDHNTENVLLAAGLTWSGWELYCELIHTLFLDIFTLQACLDLGYTHGEPFPCSGSTTVLKKN